MSLSEEARRLLCCPVCRSPLAEEGGRLACRGAGCGQAFPAVDGIPVLINESNSLFSVGDFTKRAYTTLPRVSGLRAFLGRLLPTLQRNVNTKANIARFSSLLPKGRPRVLVIGGSTVGQDLGDLLARRDVDFVESDVAFGPRTMLICDGHDLPFPDGTFDGAVIQVTLQHVADPYRCVEEIHRVLKKDGLVYAETSFIQQVCLGKYDFTRFTLLGHRRLFRKFAEVSSGAVAGPGTALAWTLRYLLIAFVRTPRGVSFVKGLTRCTLFWLKYLDYLFINWPGALDGASELFFLGRKSEGALPDRELLKLYKGVF
jgi:SAM-dependent methyltransferase